MTLTPAPMLLLTPSEVARRFGVTPSTIHRWCMEGKLAYVMTPGGHRRILDDDAAKPDGGQVAGERTREG